MDTKDKSTLMAAELAARAGVSKDTLRHYERIGVMQAPLRSERGYRLYTADHLARVLTVRKALSIGFRLDELSEFLGIRDFGGRPCAKVHKTLISKRDGLRREISERQAKLDEVEAVLLDWQDRLDQAGTNQPARLLDSLVTQK